MSLIRKHVAVLQAWACLALVTACSKLTASNMKSLHKPPTATSNKYQVTQAVIRKKRLFVLIIKANV